MTSYPRRTPATANPSDIDTLESTYGFTFPVNNKESPVGSGKYIGSFTVPAGHYARISFYGTSYFRTSAGAIFSAGTFGNNDDYVDVILLAGQSVQTGSGHYVLYEV